MPTLDHTIVRVHDLDETVAFWTRLLGVTDEGRDGPFAVVRVSPTLTLQLAPWGTKGGEHFAFAMEPAEFEASFRKIREEGIDYGDAFDRVGNMKGPGRESGAGGVGMAIYFFDPNRHLLEIRAYESGTEGRPAEQ